MDHRYPRTARSLRLEQRVTQSRRRKNQARNLGQHHSHAAETATKIAPSPVGSQIRHLLNHSRLRLQGPDAPIDQGPGVHLPRTVRLRPQHRLLLRETGLLLHDAGTGHPRDILVRFPPVLRLAGATLIIDQGIHTAAVRSPGGTERRLAEAVHRLLPHPAAQQDHQPVRHHEDYRFGAGLRHWHTEDHPDPHFNPAGVTTTG